MELSTLTREMIDTAVTQYRSSNQHANPQNYLDSDQLTAFIRALIVAVMQQGDNELQRLQAATCAAFQYGFESAMILMQIDVKGLVH